MNTWTVIIRSSEASGTSFGPTNLVANPPAGLIAYERLNAPGSANLFNLTKRDFRGSAFDYVRGMNFTRSMGADFDSTHCVFGVPTSTNDTFPVSRTNYANIAVTGVGFVRNGSTGELSKPFDMSSSVATFSADVDAEDPIITTLSLRGREILADGSLSDTVTAFRDYGNGFSAINVAPGESAKLGDEGVDRAELTGAFAFGGTSQIGAGYTGWFFGPQAREAGYAFWIEYGTPTGDQTFAFVGFVLAKQ